MYCKAAYETVPNKKLGGGKEDESLWAGGSRELVGDWRSCSFVTVCLCPVVQRKGPGPQQTPPKSPCLFSVEFYSAFCLSVADFF